MAKVAVTSLNQIIIPKRIWQQVCAHTRETLPEEACGLLAGKEGRVYDCFAIPNILHSPVKYRMDPVDQLRAFLQIESKALELIGIFHSHPSGPDHPSETDVAEAYYPDSAYIILYPSSGSWKARGFIISSQKEKEIPLMIVEDI